MVPGAGGGRALTGTTRDGDHEGMSTNFLHHATSQGATSAAPSAVEPERYVAAVASAQHADRSCCCSARPAVITVMPPTASRAHETELLLCVQHYRASRSALLAAGATVLGLDGTPVAADPWELVRADA